MPRSVGTRSRGVVANLVGVEVIDGSIGLDLHLGRHVGGGEGVETPVDAEVDAGDGVVEDGFPETGESSGDVRTHGAELVRDRLGGVILWTQIAADAVQFIGDGGEADVVGGVVGEVEVVTTFVVEAHCLEDGAAKGGVA